jgi:ribosomal protein L37AE/L43A
MSLTNGNVKKLMKAVTVLTKRILALEQVLSSTKAIPVVVQERPSSRSYSSVVKGTNLSQDKTVAKAAKPPKKIRIFKKEISREKRTAREKAKFYFKLRKGLLPKRKDPVVLVQPVVQARSNVAPPVGKSVIASSVNPRTQGVYSERAAAEELLRREIAKLEAKESSGGNCPKCGRVAGNVICISTCAKGAFDPVKYQKDLENKKRMFAEATPYSRSGSGSSLW